MVSIYPVIRSLVVSFAKELNYNLDPEELEALLDTLAPYGLPQIAEAFEQILDDDPPRGYFPSHNELKRILAHDRPTKEIDETSADEAL